MKDLIDINNKIPEKGKDIIGYDSNNDEHYVFRCNCNNDNCMQWRCSITGSHMMINIIKWKYI